VFLENNDANENHFWCHPFRVHFFWLAYSIIITPLWGSEQLFTQGMSALLFEVIY